MDANGAWNYTASSAHPEFVAGTNYSDVFTVTSADGTTSTITVNILGTNDAAVISTATANLTGNGCRTDDLWQPDHHRRRQRSHLRGRYHRWHLWQHRH
ncbi:VCBS domain-containing protein [Massilia sp. B-10]|nr:VCBS domain-containing protein [Massilia sp. B-10]